MVVDDLRVRHRQGKFRVVDGVPVPDARTSLAILPNSVAGRWLGSRAHEVRGDLLDLGAGNQPFRAWYEGLASSVVAVDATPAPGINVLAYATRLPFADECFDTVLCTSVLEHVDSPEAAISEAYRVLRPGGRILITVPFMYPTHEAPYDFWRTTHYGLRSVLERHGFDVEDLSAQGGPFVLLVHYLIGGLAQVLLLLARRLGRLGGLVDNRILRTALVAPQTWLASRLNHRLTPWSRTVSLGYMASARRTAGADPIKG